ncbi:MAG: DUF4178 domain-containing protein [Pirellulaceae bacterium]
MAFSGNCPNCGAPVEFTAARSIVLVCESCESVVGRSGDALENYGKVADLVQTSSPLQVGATGAWRGRPFEIVGRVQMKHSSGAVWDEWYAAFDGGERWGWIAEAQNRVTLTFAKRLPANAAIANQAQLDAGQSVTIPAVGQYTVAETGSATIGYAEGEIPFLVRPGSTYEYADLEGPHGRFATIDFRTSPPTAFVGQRVTYADVGLEKAEDREIELPTAQTVSVNCTSCGGSLDLRAPDATERVVCPFCDTIHDVNKGNLKFLAKLTQDSTKPLLPLGSEGTLRGRKYTVIGHMRREVVVEGTHYPWDEYLLSTPREPFAWLIHAQGHWMLGSAVSSGEVSIHGRQAYCQGRRFRLFDQTRPRVIAVHGEFPWKVQFGETVSSSDYISPPFMLSCEKSASISAPLTMAEALEGRAKPVQSPTGMGGGWSQPPTESQPDADELAPIPLEPNDNEVEPAWIEPVDDDAPSAPPKETTKPKPKRLPKSSNKKSRRMTVEVNYTLSEYIPRREVSDAFGLGFQGIPTTVAPAQPFLGYSLYRTAGIALVAVLLIYAALSIVFRPKLVHTVQAHQETGTQEVWSEPFELKGGRNVRLQANCTTQQWCYFEGGLHNETTDTTREFSMAMDGSSTRTKYLSGVTAGTYRLRIRPEYTSNPPTGQVLTVRISQGAVNPAPWLLIMGIAAGTLVLVGAFHGLFENQRWQESSMSGS